MNIRIDVAVVSLAISASLTNPRANAQDSGASKPAIEELVGPAPFDASLQAREARLAGDAERWLSLGTEVLRRTPVHPDLLVGICRAYIALGRTDEALRLLRDAVARGTGFDATLVPDLAKLNAAPGYSTLIETAARNLVPLRRAHTHAKIDDTAMRPEGITYDPETRHYFLGRARDEIWRIDDQGRATLFASGGLRPILGLKIDARRRLLWAASAVFPDFRLVTPANPEQGISGLIAFDLATGERKHEHWLDERLLRHGFNDLAIAKSGAVFVTYSSPDTVWRYEPERKRLTMIARGRDMSSPNGIVLSPDQKPLHVAHIEGISAIDLKQGRRIRHDVPANAPVNSIDGLAYRQGGLLDLQNSPFFARAIRIVLDRRHKTIREVIVLNSRTHASHSQTTGAVVGNDFYSIAGFGPTNTAPSAPMILRIPIGSYAKNRKIEVMP